MTMTCKINKLEKPGGPQSNFHALFGRSAAVYGHFRADAVTSEWFTRISHQLSHDFKIALNSYVNDVFRFMVLLFRGFYGIFIGRYVQPSQNHLLAAFCDIS